MPGAQKPPYFSFFALQDVVLMVKISMTLTIQVLSVFTGRIISPVSIKFAEWLEPVVNCMYR